FLFGVARNLALKLDEARQRHPGLPEPPDDDGAPELDAASESAGPLARLLGNEAAEEVRRALSLLPPHYRDPVILYELHD
ncbi:RNA polymerase sigma factor, partial [Acinetobacter baumannii]|uniref:RNA polymerase sigma factor n=1 Tax=Acinetobacter baumannii TaxID=470 RepID=UPI00289270C7